VPRRRFESVNDVRVAPGGVDLISRTVSSVG